MDIHKRVLEYWPELSKSWGSAVKAKNYYQRNPEDLETEVEAADKIRALSKRPEEDRGNVSTYNEESGLVPDEIQKFGRDGLTLDEIRRRTQASVKRVTGTDSTPWSDKTIWRYLDVADRERVFGTVDGPALAAIAERKISDDDDHD